MGEMCDSRPVPGSWTEEPVQDPIMRLHPDADAILVVQSNDTASENPRKEFLVSSAVLSAASAYFRALLRSEFKGGAETRRGDCPTIVMGEDNPVGMKILLSVLHYHDLEAYDTLDPETMAAVAICSDQYDCTRALRPWISQWFGTVNATADVDELGFLLVAAHFFHSADRLNDVSARCVRHARAGLASVWEKHPMINLLPPDIKDVLAARVSQTLDKLHRELQAVEGRLRIQGKGHRMDHSVCARCGRRFPGLEVPKQCHLCQSSTVHEGYCTNQTRIAEYFGVLGRTGLWPSFGPFKECTVSELADRLGRVKCDQQHRCEADTNCPLRRALEGLSHNASRILKDIEGISPEKGETT